MKTLIQSDFDGTITPEDISFQILDAFADGDWQRQLEEYKSGRISVGLFNTRAFAMVKEKKKELIDFVRRKASVREGFSGLVSYCRKKGHRFTIVSNGLDFYISTILSDMDLGDI